MDESDISSVAEIHRQAFKRQQDSELWIKCNFQAYPRMQYFLADDCSSPIGYIVWSQRSGFRPEVVLELEQIAVLKEYQGKGIGTQLITESLQFVRKQLSKRNATIKHIIVNTRADNMSQNLYRKTLGVKIEYTIKDLYSHDEVFMIARNFDE
jgi:ribosomal protein S18 acetylase RimI-like enzyme